MSLLWTAGLSFIPKEDPAKVKLHCRLKASLPLMVGIVQKQTCMLNTGSDIRKQKNLQYTFIPSTYQAALTSHPI
jgi:hypothetical protein